jgi:hypothetical protein
MRDAAISLREFRYQRKKGAQEIAEWLGKQAASLVANAKRWSDKVTVVRYEQFATDPSYRDDIAAAIDWPLTGDPNRGLIDYRRSDEIRTGIFPRRSLEDRDRHPDLVEAICRVSGEYQEFFGYE